MTQTKEYMNGYGAHQFSMGMNDSTGRLVREVSPAQTKTRMKSLQHPVQGTVWVRISSHRAGLAIPPYVSNPLGDESDPAIR